MPDIEIKALRPSPDILHMLSEMLVETVSNGGSVGFMHPLSLEGPMRSGRIRLPVRCAAGGSFSGL
jgi:hypothetical protein